MIMLGERVRYDVRPDLVGGGTMLSGCKARMTVSPAPSRDCPTSKFIANDDPLDSRSERKGRSGIFATPALVSNTFRCHFAPQTGKGNRTLPKAISANCQISDHFHLNS